MNSVMRHAIGFGASVFFLSQSIGAVISATTEPPPNMTLVLSTGAAVSLSGDGKRFAGDIKSLLGDGASNADVFDAIPDFKFGRMYLIPNVSYEKIKALVYDLRSLGTLGELPGVTSVTIPVSSNVDRFIARVFTAAPDSDTSIYMPWQLLRDGHVSETVELRARNNPLKILQRHVADAAMEASSFSCYSSARSGHFGNMVRELIGSNLETEDVSGDLSTRNHVSQGAGVVEGCWPNGDVWTVQILASSRVVKRYRESTHGVVELPDAAGWGSKDAARETLGNTGRYLAIMPRRFGSGTFKVGVFDFEKKRVVQVERDVKGLNDKDSLFSVGLSSNRDIWFLATGTYVKGTDGQVEMSDRLFRVGVRADTPFFEEVELPNEFVQVYALRLTQSIASTGNETERAEAKERLPGLEKASEANRLLRFVYSVRIISVLLSQ